MKQTIGCCVYVYIYIYIYVYVYTNSKVERTNLGLRVLGGKQKRTTEAKNGRKREAKAMINHDTTTTTTTTTTTATTKNTNNY